MLAGGTISGIGRRIREALPQCKIVGVEPAGSVFSGASAGFFKRKRKRTRDHHRLTCVPSDCDSGACDMAFHDDADDDEGSGSNGVGATGSGKNGGSDCNMEMSTAAGWKQSYFVEGIGSDFKPDVLDSSVVDRWIQVTAEESFYHARRLIREEGYSVEAAQEAHWPLHFTYVENISSQQISVYLSYYLIQQGITAPHF